MNLCDWSSDVCSSDLERGERKSWPKAQHPENEDHGIWSHHFMGNRWGNSGNSVRLFWGVPKSLQMVIAAMKLKTLAPWKKNYDQPRQHIKQQRHYFTNKGPSSQSYFSSSHVSMWSWTIKKCERQRIDAFELWCWRRLLRVLGLQGDQTCQS